MKKLVQFGLQKVNAKEADNVCPQDSSEKGGISLDLDSECSLYGGISENDPTYFNKIKAQFEILC